MGKVAKIGISRNSGGRINEVLDVEAIQGKGLVNDRHFIDGNDAKSQITLIERENIEYYNKKFKTNISEVSFRRNIVTEKIKLNNLVGKEFYIGNVKVKGRDLCRPCKHLQESLEQKNIVKEFLQKGGLRCEILSSGKIFVDDIIRYNND